MKTYISSIVKLESAVGVSPKPFLFDFSENMILKSSTLDIDVKAV